MWSYAAGLVIDVNHVVVCQDQTYAPYIIVHHPQQRSSWSQWACNLLCYLKDIYLKNDKRIVCAGTDSDKM